MFVSDTAKVVYDQTAQTYWVEVFVEEWPEEYDGEMSIMELYHHNHKFTDRFSARRLADRVNETGEINLGHWTLLHKDLSHNF
jgi:hypothetical protein